MSLPHPTVDETDEAPYYLDLESLSEEVWQGICESRERGKEEQLLVSLLEHMLHVEPAPYATEEEEGDDWLAAEDADL